MKTVEERLKSYEPLWENWTYSGEFLGEGAMSSVFEIQSTAMGFREVAALKIITVKKNFRGEVKIPDNALNEIKILRDLSGCPNIVQYQDSTQRQIFDENGNLSEIDILIKMEKLKPLHENDSLSETQVINLAKDMCAALSHAATHGIIHRDIKPQNIFVDDEGTYKLGDFGIAKIVSDFSASYTMNVGTLAYTAPEVRGSVGGVYDIASDIYSLGLVLYIFLNDGRMPFASSCATLNDAIAKRLAGAAFPSPSRGSKNLKTIVMRACSADINKRYKTPQEMLDDLELLSTGGKKMVVDPFSTMDANIDVSDVYTTPAYSGTGESPYPAASSPSYGASGGFAPAHGGMAASSPAASAASPAAGIYSAGAKSASAAAPAAASSGRGLKINMSKPKTASPAATPAAATPVSPYAAATPASPYAPSAATPVSPYAAATLASPYPPSSASSPADSSSGSRLRISMGTKKTGGTPASSPAEHKSESTKPGEEKTPASEGKDPSAFFKNPGSF